MYLPPSLRWVSILGDDISNGPASAGWLASFLFLFFLPSFRNKQRQQQLKDKERGHSGWCRCTDDSKWTRASREKCRNRRTVLLRIPPCTRPKLIQPPPYADNNKPLPPLSTTTQTTLPPFNLTSLPLGLSHRHPLNLLVLVASTHLSSSTFLSLIIVVVVFIRLIPLSLPTQVKRNPPRLRTPASLLITTQQHTMSTLMNPQPLSLHNSPMHSRYPPGRLGTFVCFSPSRQKHNRATN